MSNKSFIGQLTSKFGYIVGGILFIVSLYFWIFRYPAHLAFQEQSQLFLMNCDYFYQFLKYPSGIAVYIGEFLTQFYYEIWWGAAIVSILVFAIYALTYIILSRIVGRYKIMCTIGALVPSLFVWAFMLDRFSLLAMPIALIVSLISIYLYLIWAKKISNGVIKISIILVTTSILYWTFGAITFLFGIFVTLTEIIKNRQYAYAIILVVCALLPVLAYIVVPFPLQRLYTSNCYYKVLDSYPSFKYDAEEEEALLYSYFSRYKKWDTAIKRATKKMPMDLASRQIVLHALAEKNQLLDRLFEFPILFKMDLISAQSSEMAEATSISDLYFSLGFVNQAELTIYNMQQLYYSHSARAFQRLIECNIVKGDYRVAKKYINTLKQTIFYREWAEKMEKMMTNESFIEAHHYYGTIRHRMIDDTFFFSVSEIDNILAHSIKGDYNT
ncbi:MAG: DUF6057 family protein [Bacteroidia bacterium]|nr:DUF6057 family protein [Bacteroidia bacterium]